jgi:hypothetical protein
MMAEFDFSKVQAKKSEKVPALTRSRQSKPNPLTAQYDVSNKDSDKDGYGSWQYLDLPGKVETTTDPQGREKITYGNVVKQAQNYLRQAAAASDKGVSFRVEEPNEKNKLAAGTLRVHYQAKPKRGSDH